MKKHKTLITAIVSTLIIGINLGGAFIYYIYKSSYTELTEKYDNLLREHRTLDSDYNTTKEDTIELVKFGG